MAANQTDVVNCKQCNIEINVYSKNLIKCSGVCDNYFHCGCVNFKDYETKLMSSKNCNLLWMCNECKVQFYSSKEILKVIGELKAIINKQSNQIESLSNQVNRLSLDYSTKSTKDKDIKNHSKKEAKVKSKVEDRDTIKDISPLLAETKPSKPDSAEVNQIIQTQNDEIQLTTPPHDESGGTEPNDSFVTVVNKKKSNRKVIIGTASDADEEIKAVSKTPRSWIHVSRFQLDFSEDQLKRYIGKKTSVNNIVCFKYKSRNENSTYSSFKIGIEKEQEDLFLNANIWPAGIAVSKFEFFRSKKYYNNRR